MKSLAYLARLKAAGLPWHVKLKNLYGPEKLSGWFVETSSGVVVAYVGDSADSAERAAFIAGWANTTPALERLVTTAERSRDPELRQALANLRDVLSGAQ